MPLGLISNVLGTLFLAPTTGVPHLLVAELIAFLTAPSLNIFGNNFRWSLIATPSKTLLRHGSFWLRGPSVFFAMLEGGAMCGHALFFSNGA